MKVETWAQLFELVNCSEIERASKGLISRQLAFYWKKNGLPRSELSGLDDRCRFIVKAAKTNAITITRAEILALNADFKRCKK